LFNLILAQCKEEIFDKTSTKATFVFIFMLK